MLVVLLCLPGLLLLCGLTLWLSSLKYRHLPGLPVPVIGDLYQALTSYTTDFVKLTNMFGETVKKYGDVACMWYGPVVLVVLSDPILIEDLSVHPLLADKEPLIYNWFYGIFRGIFSKSRTDKTWKRNRKRLVGSMNKMSLESYNTIFAKRSMELVEVMEAEEGEFDVQPLVILMSFDVIGETMAGYRYNHLKQKNIGIFQEMFDFNSLLMSRILSMGRQKLNMDFARNYSTFYNELTMLLHVVIDRVRGNKPSSQQDLGFVPFIENLVGDQLQKGIPDDDILPHISEAFLESFYTTGMVISGALLFLAVHQEYQEKAYQELCGIFGDSTEPPTLEELKRMEYLERVIKEAVRWITAPLLARRARGEIRVGNCVIPNNATVVISGETVRKNPKYYEKPDAFYPDHFLPEEVAKRPKLAYMGFGIGIRNCPGYQYALNLSKVVLTTVLRNLKLSSPLRPEDLEFKPSVFMQLQTPYSVRVERRVPAVN